MCAEPPRGLITSVIPLNFRRTMEAVNKDNAVLTIVMSG